MIRLSLAGQRFGKLTVLEDAGNDASGNSIWRCACECGRESMPRGSDLRSGRIHSCGCLISAVQKASVTKHGIHHTRRYRIWSGMIGRTTNPDHISFERYGGRGISVCDEWRSDVKAFFDWAAKNGYADHLTIERINNDGDYSPKNCTWVTAKSQAKNRRKRKGNGMKTFKTSAAQGEVYIQKVTEIPDVQMTKIMGRDGFIIVAHSESGHHHGFCDDGTVEVLERGETPSGIGILYAIVKAPTEFRQGASTPHEAITLDEGLYCLRIAREYDPITEQARRVAD